MIHVVESEGNKEAILAKLNKLNWEGEQYMKHAEKKCRQIKLGCISFSLEALSSWEIRSEFFGIPRLF
jgi:hypothetical protein